MKDPRRRARASGVDTNVDSQIRKELGLPPRRRGSSSGHSSKTVVPHAPTIAPRQIPQIEVWEPDADKPRLHHTSDSSGSSVHIKRVNNRL